MAPVEACAVLAIAGVPGTASASKAASAKRARKSVLLNLVREDSGTPQLAQG
jgi:hypothetical protein